MVTQLPTHKQKKSSDFHEAQEINSLHLAQMEKMAAIGQLSSSVAHEMRNLLGMIRTASYNINKALKTTDPTILNNLDIITRSVGRAKEFIDNLLNLSRVPRGKEEMMDIGTVVDYLLPLFSKEFEWRNIKLIRTYDRFPDFYIDRHKLQECLLNLILNAIQSIENGGTLTIRIVSWKKGVRISVIDTGCGIAPNKLNTIFDQFYTTKKHGQGTGLGLTIARSLAQNMGGDIDVESRLGEGSRFTISLPSLIPVAGSSEKIERR